VRTSIGTAAPLDHLNVARLSGLLTHPFGKCHQSVIFQVPVLHFQSTHFAGYQQANLVTVSRQRYTMDSLLMETGGSELQRLASLVIHSRYGDSEQDRNSSYALPVPYYRLALPRSSLPRATIYRFLPVNCRPAETFLGGIL